MFAGLPPKMAEVLLSSWDLPLICRPHTPQRNREEEESFRVKKSSLKGLEKVYLTGLSFPPHTGKKDSAKGHRQKTHRLIQALPPPQASKELGYTHVENTGGHFHCRLLLGVIL